MSRRPKPEVPLEEAVARYQAGENTPQLAERYGCSTTYMWRLLTDAGVEMRPRGPIPIDRGTRKPVISRAERARLTQERAEEWARRYQAGESLRDIADTVGYSYEAVRKQLIKAGITCRGIQAELRAEREARRRAEREAAAPVKRCAACDEDFKALDARRVTCSEACATALNLGRRYLREGEQERHRLAVARGILRRPEGRPESLIRWAERILAGDEGPSTRRWHIRGSRATQAVVSIGRADALPPASVASSTVSR